MNPIEKAFCRTYQSVFKLALPVMPYREPVILESVNWIIGALRKKHIHSVLLVTDAHIRKLGLTEPLEKRLKREKIMVSVYDEVKPNPTVGQIEEARKLYIRGNCKAIIAFGGGSSMDCAKIVGARIKRPRLQVKDMEGILKILLPTPLLIAVPTTAGTGSEATLAAVITDEKEHYKYPINDFCLIPDYAVLDPKVTKNLPADITATTGMDALTHAVEAFIGNTTNKLTRRMSVEAVCLIHKYLYRAYTNGKDMKARAAMLRAAYCAGVAFTRSYVGYVHGIAHSLGGRYGVAHGLANAVILPYFLEEYGSKIDVKLAVLARKSGIAGDYVSDRTAARAFIDWVWEMNAKMNIPTYIEQIKTEDIPAMAKRAAHESNPLYPVPRLMNAKELEKMYRRIMKQR